MKEVIIFHAEIGGRVATRPFGNRFPEPSRVIEALALVPLATPNVICRLVELEEDMTRMLLRSSA
jgi:hypothetical protein